MTDRYYSPEEDDNFVMRDHFDQLSRDSQVKYMVHWFHGLFWDPANETPYNGREGGYLYIHGGPYDASDEFYEEFGAIVSDDVIQEAVDEVETDGITEWAPTHAHPDQIAYREDALADDDEPPIPSLEEIRRRLAEDVSPQFGNAYENESRIELQGEISRLRELLANQTPQYGGMGHNRPPDDMALTDELAADLDRALGTADSEIGKREPDVSEVAAAAGVFQRLLAWGAAKADLTLDAFLKSFGTAAGVGIVAVGDWKSIWSQLVEVSQATLKWLGIVTLPF